MNKCYWCDGKETLTKIPTRFGDVFLCPEDKDKLLNRQWSGNSYREKDDNFSIKTIHGQIFQGFKTEAEAKEYEEKEFEKGFKIIESGYYLMVDDQLYEATRGGKA